MGQLLTSSPHPPPQGSWEARIGDLLQFKENTPFRQEYFFPKNFIGGNYKTFTVQCLQSQSVVN